MYCIYSPFLLFRATKKEAAIVVISSDSDSENDNIPLSDIKKEIDTEKRSEELATQEREVAQQVVTKPPQKEKTDISAVSEQGEKKDCSTQAQAAVETVTKSDSDSKPGKNSVPNSGVPDKVDTRSSSNSDSDSDDCIISQEDLLAKLGLNSVRRASMKDMNHKDSEQNTVSKQEPRKPLFCDRPKESIIELLKVPKPLALDKNKRRNGEVDAGELLTNGSVDDCDSRPESPLNDEEELHCKERLIAKLKGELRNEEAKLLLLKKLYASQNDAKAGTTKSQKENVVNGKSYPFSQQVSSIAQQYKAASQLGKKASNLLPPPPPLKIASTSSGSNLKASPVSIQPRILPKANKGPMAAQGQTSTRTVNSPHSVAKQTASSAPSGSAIGMLQNVISSMSNSLAHPTPLYPRSGSQGGMGSNYPPNQPAPLRPTPVRANTMQSMNSSSSYSSYQSQSGQQSASSAVSQAGKQAAAKMALRKQLEKTLLQIPPPKPPPPEWSFIPSLNSPDFMTLMGLEEVVKAIAIKEGKANVDPLGETTKKGNPRVCTACGTDFTPGWRKKPSDSSGAIICEKCSTANVKKELKAEHTARLKAAFLKALKQEQEIEQKMNESTPIAPKPQQGQKVNTGSQAIAAASQHHHLPHHQSVIHHHHQSVQPNIYHHHQPAHADSLLYQLQQQHLQQQQQEMEAARRHSDVRWHPYMSQHRHSTHKPQHHSPFATDTDRQYLLDMIPSMPSHSLGYSSKY